MRCSKEGGGFNTESKMKEYICMLTLQLAICSTHGLLKYLKISHIPFIKKKNSWDAHISFSFGHGNFIAD